ncbi:MAG: BlaI/MecI/CopY family transcriptional regulator [Acidobacteria bacterium]|nr:BlaI/MecI/CopY family transcriptional regulator [Acidobacteriota bacterium]MCW5948114.1 BlaI/MecI/CopY family transcriptional regulator [Pyrinomonadaceae bacterium]
MALPKFKILGYRSPREAVMATVGPLERRVLDLLAGHEEATVRGILSELGDAYAYTTVMTTLDRLFKKGFLDRRQEDRAYVYRLRYSDEDVKIGIAGDFISSLIDAASGRPEPVLACIVEAVSDRDRELLDDLERLVKDKKAELGSRVD